MKKMYSLLLIIGLLLLCGCQPQTVEENVISPLPVTLDINNLKDCTVAVSLEKGDIFVDDNGNLQMNINVFTYDLYDMVDIAGLEVGDTFIRLGEKIEITEIERLDTGLIHINGGDEKGGFDLNTNDNTVYYECGLSDIKAYYELGEITLPIGEEFVYSDESDLDAEPLLYTAEDLLTEEDVFTPHNTKVIIQNGYIVKMIKSYMP